MESTTKPAEGTEEGETVVESGSSRPGTVQTEFCGTLRPVVGPDRDDTGQGPQHPSTIVGPSGSSLPEGVFVHGSFSVRRLSRESGLKDPESLRQGKKGRGTLTHRRDRRDSRITRETTVGPRGRRRRRGVEDDFAEVKEYRGGWREREVSGN